MAVQERIGAFVPTTEEFEIENIEDININSPEFRDFLIRLRLMLNNHANTLNIKDTGIYDPQEFVNGQVWFPDPTLGSSTAQKPVERQVYRTVVNFGALPNTATKTVAHNITFPTISTLTATRIYGASTDPVAQIQIPLPYSSPTLVNNIELYFNATNVVITTGANYSAYTTTYIVLEYIKE